MAFLITAVNKAAFSIFKDEHCRAVLSDVFQAKK
jgi:hypothetical protein